jgi:hypothetical protein
MKGTEKCLRTPLLHGEHFLIIPKTNISVPHFSVFGFIQADLHDQAQSF